MAIENQQHWLSTCVSSLCLMDKALQKPLLSNVITHQTLVGQCDTASMVSMFLWFDVVLVTHRTPSSSKYPLWRTCFLLNTNPGFKIAPSAETHSIIIMSSRFALCIFTHVVCFCEYKYLVLSISCHHQVGFPSCPCCKCCPKVCHKSSGSHQAA